MLDIPIITASARRGRATPRVARVLHGLLPREGVRSEIIDLARLDLPIMEERVRKRDDAPAGALEFSERLDRADGIAVVTPEYNGSMPGVLKNALDYVYPELTHKPVGIVTVSVAGGGVSVLNALRLVFLRMKAMPIPAHASVHRVSSTFPDTDAVPDADQVRHIRQFAERLVWYTEAITTHKRSRPLPT